MAEEVKTRKVGPGRIRGVARISSKHQITIPIGELRAAGLAAGDCVRAQADPSGRIVLTPLNLLADRYSGSLDSGGSLRSSLEELRDEWP